MSAPAPADAASLSLAVAAHFAPCTCEPRAGRICAGHAFLLDDPTRRMGCKVWQRLLFVRSQRSALLAQEGTPSPAPVAAPALPDPNKLPW